jgi:hypothetical protein
MPEAVTAFSSSHPVMTVLLREMSSAQQVSVILDSHVSGGFLHYSAPLHPDLEFLKIGEERFVGLQEFMKRLQTCTSVPKRHVRARILV